jgi:nucleoporin GLE1
VNKQIIPQVNGNPALKKACFEAKMKIRPKVGQITNSKQHILRIVSK